MLDTRVEVYSPLVRRIERLINLIAALLDSDRPLTAEDIRAGIKGYEQESKEAFRRAFERDKEDLRALGIPVELRRLGVFGDDPEGYTIPKDRYYLPELDLEPDELAALRIAADAVLGAGDQAETGLMKLSMDEPSPAWSGPRLVWGADVASEDPHLTPLYDALLSKRRVSFTYHPVGRDPGPRTVEPYAVVHRSGHWYLVGRDVDKGETRSYKLSRITSSIQSEPGDFTIPEGFDWRAKLATPAWEIGPGAPQDATVRFDPSIRWWAEQNLSESPAREGPEGSLEVTMPAANLDALVEWALGFGSEVEIIAPPEARAVMLDRLSRFVNAGG